MDELVQQNAASADMRMMYGSPTHRLIRRSALETEVAKQELIEIMIHIRSPS